MTKLNFIFITIILYTFGSCYIYGQGCSDAGFCTIDSFKPNTNDSTKVANNQLKVGAFFGIADNSISVYGNYFEYSKFINKRFGFNAKLSTLAQNGNGISSFGLSDIFVNTNYMLGKKLKLTLGTKIPLSDANNTYNNRPLPMDYQSSLGTLDIIFGIGYEIKKIQFVVAIQQPLSQNDNQFISTNYSVDSKLRAFLSTNKFKRSGDILLRLSYPVNISSKFTFTPSVLPIYHLANDKFTDEFNIEKEIEGSQGFTLNGNAYLDYKLNNKSSIQLNLGMPFVVRNNRPDGLTRSFIANLEYLVRF